MAGKLTIALAGNPNSGKTTAFNMITGARQHVGNYPGITVDKKEGRVTVNGRLVNIIDLPGIYSLTAYSQEEIVSRNVLTEERPHAVIDVLNSVALERNLYLAVQLLELGVPVVLALNMIDEARQQGLWIDRARLSSLLGVPVVETVASTGEGMEDLLSAAVTLGEERQGKEWTPLDISYGPDLDPVLETMSALIADVPFLGTSLPTRWVALKYLENDTEIKERGAKADKEVHAKLEELAQGAISHLHSTLDTYPEAVIADYRYGYITSLLRQGVVRRQHGLKQRLAISDRIDRVLTHKLLGPICLLAILYFVYMLTFTVGEIPMGWVENLFAWLEDFATEHMQEGLLQSLVVSGMIAGVGGVMGFVPLILCMFIVISFLEDSGYMARIAYMLDRIFRAFGLHGSSVMPFIVSGGIAGGCAVPGVMAARTLRSPREKLATLLTVPFMACGAKLPVFILFVAVFFPENEALVMFLLTLAGWAAALLVARLLRSTLIKGESTPFVMELPPYRLPTMRGLLIHAWERAWMYIKKAGTIILAVSILLWAAMTFPELSAEQKAVYENKTAQFEEQIEAAKAAEALELVASLEEELGTVANDEAAAALRYSFAGRIGTSLEGVTEIAGFDWRTNIALLGGIAAKEVIVSTLGTAYSLGEVDAEESAPLAARIKRDTGWNKAKALSVMLFVLLYAPCFVAVVCIKQEAGSWKWAAFSVLFNTVFAFGISVIVYRIGQIFL